MALALMAALPEELHPLRAALEDAQLQHHAGREFHTGRLDGHDVVLVLSRIGKVAAASATSERRVSMVVTNFIGFLPKSPGETNEPQPGQANSNQDFIDKKQTCVC